MVKKNSLTLIELLVSIFILSSVVLAALSLEIAARRFSSTATKDTEVLNTISPAIEHITKYVTFARNVTSPAETSLLFFLDLNNTPWDTTDDTLASYSFSAGNLSYNSEVIANKLTDAVFSISNDTLNVNITGRFKPSQPRSLDNPEMSLSTTISLLRSSQLE